MTAPTGKFKTLEIPVSLRDMAVKAIKEAILTDVLTTGNVYSEGKLAEELGISRTPIREALLELADRKFVTILPRKGFRVNQLSLDEIRHLFSFRRIIELGVIREIIGRISDQDLEIFNRIHQDNQVAAESRSKELLVQKDNQFHSFLVSRTENPYLISAHENVRDLIDWVGANVLKRPARSQEAINEHEIIVHQINKRNLKGTLRAMEKHINITEELIVSYLALEQQGK